MKLNPPKNKKPRIEMLPLIDTVFLVLVVFIYAMLSMVVHRGIPVNLPQATTSVPDQREYLAVTLLPDGRIFFNEEECNLGQLRSKLIQQAALNKEKPLYLNGDKAVAYGLVVSVLDLVREAGIKKVIIEATEKKI